MERSWNCGEVLETSGELWRAVGSLDSRPAKSQPRPELGGLSFGYCLLLVPSGKAGERPGSTCAIDVEGHKRRPPSKVGGLCHEFRVQFRVQGLGSLGSLCSEPSLGCGFGWGLITFLEGLIGFFG